jgi:hypothetical protein
MKQRNDLVTSSVSSSSSSSSSLYSSPFGSQAYLEIQSMEDPGDDSSTKDDSDVLSNRNQDAWSFINTTTTINLGANDSHVTESKDSCTNHDGYVTCTIISMN